MPWRIDNIKAHEEAIMPRLGDDPNVATAYPERDRMNLRGRGMRQMVNMVAIILIFFFIMFKLFTNNYKVSSKVVLL